jgi:hypothetical protein
MDLGLQGRKALVSPRRSCCRSDTAQAAAGRARFADASERGAFIAYGCSAQAAFMIGQNMVNDGSVYQGLL